jgi:hypothetical protein
MRGDSVRDFYAKTLALLGLGALASVGALVDYWPGKLDIPHVSPVRSAAMLPAAPAVLGLPLASRPLGPTLRPVRLGTTEFVTEDGTAIGLGDLAADEEVFSEPDSSPVATPPGYLEVVPVVAWSLPTSHVELLTPLFMMARLEDDATPFVVVPVPQAPASSSSNGIIGVLRKTGSGIAAVGIKTGSTIVGAFRAVGGAFRKIL